MLDADSVIEPGFFAACERALATGAARSGTQREQPRALAREEASLAAFTLQGITIPRGRDRLGVSVRLRGTGMAIAASSRSRTASVRRRPRTSSSRST